MRYGTDSARTCTWPDEEPLLGPGSARFLELDVEEKCFIKPVPGLPELRLLVAEVEEERLIKPIP